MFQVLKADIEAYIRYDDSIKTPTYYFRINNILEILKRN